MTDDQLFEKRHLGILFVCLTTLGIVFYLLAVSWIEQTAFIDFKTWDLATVTVGDFSVEMIIT